MKRRVCFNWKNALLFIFCAVFIIVCLWRPVAVQAAAKPALDRQALALNQKQSKMLKIKNVKKNRIKKVTYKSGKKTVAKVNSQGKVTGVKAGKAVITCRLTLKSGKNYTLKCKVTVKKESSAKGKPTVYMTKISVPTG